MIVTFWRHGEAGQAAIDRQRQLTDRGCDDISFGSHQFLSALLARGMPAPGIIFHSPWERTVQTARIIASAFTHAAVNEMDALRPDSNVAAVDTALSALRASPDECQHVVLVSHQPLVSQLVDHYLGANGGAPSLSPGGLVTVALAAASFACGELRFWAFPPEYEAGI